VGGNKIDRERALKFLSEIWSQRTRLTADKREIKDFPQLPTATSFIRKTLGEIAEEMIN